MPKFANKFLVAIRFGREIGVIIIFRRRFSRVFVFVFVFVIPFSLSAEVILAEQYGLHREQSNEVHVECEVVDHHKEDHVGFPDIDCIHESVQFKRILRTY